MALQSSLIRVFILIVLSLAMFAEEVQTYDQAIQVLKRTDTYKEMKTKFGENLEIDEDKKSEIGIMIYLGEFVKDDDEHGHRVRKMTILIKWDGSVWENADNTGLEQLWTMPVK